jgi:hypothetical protein
MEKLGRFCILVVLYVILFIIGYSIIPGIAWIFGAPFTYVAQSPVYVIIGNILVHVTLGCLFESCFDTNFKSKR